MKKIDYQGAYDSDLPEDFFESNTYAFATKSEFVPHPFMGYRLRQTPNAYLKFTDDGGREITDGGDSPKVSNLSEHDQPYFMYGGSVMFGSYALSDSRTIPGYTQKELEGSKVFNFALPGSVFSQNFSHFLNVVLPRVTHVKHFYFILLFGFNEFQCLSKLKLKSSEIQLSYSQILFGNSLLGRLAKTQSRIKQIELERKSIDSLEEIDLALIRLKQLTSLIVKLGGTPLIALQPNLFLTRKQLFGRERKIFAEAPIVGLNSFRCRAREAFDNNEFFVDLSEVFDGVDRQVFVDGVHLGCFGNQQIARNLIEVLR